MGGGDHGKRIKLGSIEWGWAMGVRGSGWRVINKLVGCLAGIRLLEHIGEEWEGVGLVHVLVGLLLVLLRLEHVRVEWVLDWLLFGLGDTGLR